MFSFWEVSDMDEALRVLRAQINLCGITRREAAHALNLSYSALNRKLRGERHLLPEEASKLRLLVRQRLGISP